ncbi:MAG: hypothetical protein QM770_06270 [Tepidisphaeraceae bacterium]
MADDTEDTLACPDCGQPISPASIDSAADVAWCGTCSKAHRLTGLLNEADDEEFGPSSDDNTDVSERSDTSEASETDPTNVDEHEADASEAETESTDEVPSIGATIERVDTTHPPPGTWFEPTMAGFRCGARNRSTVGWVLVGFGAVWGTGVSTILALTVTEGDLIFTVCLCLFLLMAIPLLVFGTYMLAGKLEFEIEYADSTLTRSLGPIRNRRRFKWTDIRSVKYAVNGRSNGVDTYCLELEGPEPALRFGAFLPSASQAFIAGALQQSLRKR